MKKKLRPVLVLVLLMGILTTGVLADTRPVVSIGQDLNMEQRSQILAIFGADSDVEIIETSNAEEVKYLGQYVDRKILGSRAISSAYVKPLKPGSGIRVETYNISWVTEDMLISALATAGVKDAQVKVAAPFSVSGTAALTGVIKGFEGATGEFIGEEEKQVASEEIATTGELAESLGSNEASQIINKVKEEVLTKDLKSPAEIKKVVEVVSEEVNIELTEEQKEKVTELMEKISRLDINVEDIKGQLKNISDSLKELNKKTEEVKGFVAKILDFIEKIFNKIQDLFK